VSTAVTCLRAQTPYEESWADGVKSKTGHSSPEEVRPIEYYRLQGVDLARALRDFWSVASIAVAESAIEIASGFEHMLRWFEGAGTVVRPYEVPDNATAELQRASDLDRRIARLFGSVGEQSFEEGIETEFSRELERVVRAYGDNAVVAVGQRIAGGTVKPEAAAEALRWLGQMDSPITYRQRLDLLERSLSAPSAWIRDGASLGLASLDDPDAMPYLERAIEREQIPELREDLQRVLSQLEKTRQCLCS